VCTPAELWSGDNFFYFTALMGPPRTSVLANSDVHGLASGQKPSQAKPHRPGQVKPKVLAWSWLWPGLDFLKAKANGPGHGFELNILRK
jgi:hypothetical protein